MTLGKTAEVNLFDNLIKKVFHNLAALCLIKEVLTGSPSLPDPFSPIDGHLAF